MNTWTPQTIELYEQWWIEKSKKNFLAYRNFLRDRNFLYNWFIVSLCRDLQNFFIDYKKGLRPVLIINTPPQHGKSWTVTDFISWIIGLDPTLKIIYSSYSDRLGKRTNTTIQRTIDTDKYSKIFPHLNISKQNVVTRANMAKKNSELIEFWDQEGRQFDPGYFRNTTIGGAITGDTMDIGIIDDPVKGRKEARSMVISESIWEWYEDDFDTRLSENAGIILIMTRWVTHDLTGRILKTNKRAVVRNYPALAITDELNRNEGDPLFPELKSKEFLEDKKRRSSSQTWGSLYQGDPIDEEGETFKESWWRWWRDLPPLRFKFITVDTAQKKDRRHDYTRFQCWGFYNGAIYLLDKIGGKYSSPELRKIAELFYKKHDKPRIEVTDPVLRGMYIEDKSSGTGLIQELRDLKLKVYEIPRNADKILRAEDATPYVESGLVYLNVDIPGVDNIVDEGRKFPDGEFDDDIDCCMTAIELIFINKKLTSSLAAAMED